MLDVTPQERTALVVLAILLVGGAVARHGVGATDALDRLSYTAELADTLNPATLRERAEVALALENVRRSPLQPGERIDPNTAPPEQLARLPRVGPALAERIVAHRDANGPFRSLDDLGAVAGIGPALLQGVAPHVTLPARPVATFGTGQAGARIDVNRATAEELQRLPGIGPALAERIVAFRQANGPFRAVEDLEQVSGIGSRSLERLRDAVRVGS
jgi:competence ComEA-like helix-hairpin-helix protein